MSGFTPGPWTTGERMRGEITIYSRNPDRSQFLALVCPFSLCGDDAAGDAERDANARLIAAAPRFYELLLDVLPQNVCLTNRNISDDTLVQLECAMGDLRKIAEALAEARGDS